MPCIFLLVFIICLLPACVSLKYQNGTLSCASLTVIAVTVDRVKDFTSKCTPCQLIENPTIWWTYHSSNELRQQQAQVTRLNKRKIKWPKKGCFLKLLTVNIIIIASISCTCTAHQNQMTCQRVAHCFLSFCRKCALTGTSRFCLHRVKLSEKGDWHNLSRNSRVRVSLSTFFSDLVFEIGSVHFKFTPLLFM